MWIWSVHHFLSKFTEVRFAIFLPGGFTTMAVMNPPEKKLEKRTSVHCPSRLHILCQNTVHILFLSYLDKQFEKRQKLSKSQRHMTKTSSTCALMFSLTPTKWQSRKWLTCICLEVAVWNARYFNPGLFNLKLQPQNFQRWIFQPLTFFFISDI